MRRMNAWQLFGSVGAALVLAGAFYTMGVPFNDPCGPCARGELPWWWCLIQGCW